MGECFLRLKRAILLFESVRVCGIRIGSGWEG